MKTKLTDFTEKKTEDQLAQEINSIEEINNNNPVIKEEDNNPINNIEDMTDPNPLPPVNPDENVTGTDQPLKPKNTVRIMDGNFPF